MSDGRGRDMRDANDLIDVSLPPSAGKSREVDTGFGNDTKAQKEAAALLAYNLHSSNCKHCGDAQSEEQLCGVGQRIYSQMRAIGIVG